MNEGAGRGGRGLVGNDDGGERQDGKIIANCLTLFPYRRGYFRSSLHHRYNF